MATERVNAHVRRDQFGRPRPVIAYDRHRVYASEGREWSEGTVYAHMTQNERPKVRDSRVGAAIGNFPAWVSVHHHGRGYGGPEEGGWTYAVGTSGVEPTPVYNEAELKEAIRHLSVQYANSPRGYENDSGSVAYMGHNTLAITTERPLLDHYPTRRPHYE